MTVVREEMPERVLMHGTDREKHGRREAIAKDVVCARRAAVEDADSIRPHVEIAAGARGVVGQQDHKIAEKYAGPHCIEAFLLEDAVLQHEESLCRDHVSNTLPLGHGLNFSRVSGASYSTVVRVPHKHDYCLIKMRCEV